MRMGEKLWQMRERIFEANQKDLDAAIQNGLSKAKQDRLLLNEKRLADMIEGLNVLVQSSDPVGEVMETHCRPNGLKVDKVRVPFGVIAIIYESRPNVTVDAAGLALKAGNAIVLRGGKKQSSPIRHWFGSCVKGWRKHRFRLIPFN